MDNLIDNLPIAERQLALSVIFLTNCADGYKSLGDETIKKIIDLVGGQQYIDNFDENSVKDVLSYYNMSSLSAETKMTSSQPTQLNNYSYNHSSYSSSSRSTPSSSVPTYSTPTYISSTTATIIIKPTKIN